MVALGQALWHRCQDLAKLMALPMGWAQSHPGLASYMACHCHTAMPTGIATPWPPVPWWHLHEHLAHMPWCHHTHSGTSMATCALMSPHPWCTSMVTCPCVIMAPLVAWPGHMSTITAIPLMSDRGTEGTHIQFCPLP